MRILFGEMLGTSGEQTMEIKNYINDVSFIKPVCDRSKCIPVVLVCDGRNKPETMVTILSITEMEDDYYYDVVIIHNTLDEYDIAAFEHLYESINNLKLKLRFERIEHDFTKGYIHIDSNYREEYVLKCFLPVILKRYTKFLYVRSGNLLRAGITQFYESYTGEYKYKMVGVGNLAEVVVYDSAEFRIRYTVKDIKNALTRGIAELDIVFLRKLSGLMYYEAPDGIAEIYNNECPSMAFKKLVRRVPYFEKWIYECNKWDNVINAAGTYAKPLNTEFYLFPFELVPRETKLVLYGNGKVGKQYRQQIEMTHFCELVAVADRNAPEGILNPSELINLEYDYVVIAIADSTVASEIKDNLIMNGVKADKIIYAEGRKL